MSEPTTPRRGRLAARWDRLRSTPLEKYDKTWLGFIAVAVTAVLIGTMLAIHAFGAGYRHYTAEFAQAAALRAGNPIMVAGIQVGKVTSMRLAGDHVEAGLQIRDDVTMGTNTAAAIRLATILGGRYLALMPDSTGHLKNGTIDLAHTQVPYDLQSALKDATTTFEQVDSDQFASSLHLLGTQLKGVPELMPQALANLDSLSSVVAQRREQLGEILKNTELVTNTLHNQQARIGELINQSQDLLTIFIARRAVFHSMMQSLKNLVDVMSKIIVDDRKNVDALTRDISEFNDVFSQHNDLLLNMLQVNPIVLRQVANMTGDGNAFSGNGPAGILVDSWMCAISGRAQQFGMIPYFKDCK